MKQFLMGNEVLAKAAFDAGAYAMLGYPITPTTEVLSTWAKLSKKYNRYCLQTEDEMAAGFGVCGSVFAGKRAFTATGGPGMILMQDPLSMAEAMRLPMVVFDGQRGGPSTGQVIYSQQEVNLAIHGGNGEGQRIVYSPSSLQELYVYGKKAFETAWEYRFPTILLYDGYLGKMKGEVDIPENEATEIKAEKPILETNMRNTYNLEEELMENVMKNQADFNDVKDKIVEFEEEKNGESEIIVFAHGIVSSAVRIAINQLGQKGTKIAFFRPITLSPFPSQQTFEVLKKSKKAIVFESSLGQFSQLLKINTYSTSIQLIEVNKPGVGFTPEEIENKITEVIKK